MANEETMKFYDAYRKLEQIAKEMQDEPEKVIDVMEEKLKKAIELNKFCNDRLEKVQAMLTQYKAASNAIIENTVDLHRTNDEKPIESIDEKYDNGLF